MFEKLLQQLGLEVNAENIAMIKESFESETTGLKNKNSELLEKLSGYKKFDGLDLDKLKEQASNNEVNELLEALKSGSGLQMLEAIKEKAYNDGYGSAEGKYKEHIDGSTKELEQYKEKFLNLQNENDNALINEYLRSELSNIPTINKDYIPAILQFAKSQVSVEEVDGNRVASYKEKGLNEKGKEKSIADWFNTEGQKTENAWWSIQKPGTGGAGGQGGQGGSLDLEDKKGDDLLSEFGL